MKIDPLIEVSHIADAADALFRSAGQGAGGKQWLGPPGTMVIGRAFTLRQRAVTPNSSESSLKLMHREVAAELAEPGDVIVIQVEGSTKGATWGEAHAMRAYNRGVAGVLIDGTTRDFDGLKSRGLPVLCRGASPFKSTGRLETAAMRGDVEIMGVRIRHGDIVAIDADGFMCLAAADADVVLARALEIARQEDARNQDLIGAAP